MTRLKNILKDYKDGLTVIKELLQNADDAEATEVNICYDGRTHSVEPSSLFFPGKAKCHGPALIVHNNAVFKKQDFENITKLAGATKMAKPLKIGQFGVGFCSVYHITDVPSFVSGKWLYIFDPAIRFLKNEITNQAKPGKKLKFTEKVVHYSHQLVPYQDLFGFKQEKLYQGTIFRFPFRTSPSELSSILYSKTHVQELLADVQKAGTKLFLFLNHVRRITFSWIDASDSVPSLLFSMDKSTSSNISLPRECEIQQITIIDNKIQVTSSECWLTASEKEDPPYSCSDSVIKRSGIASVVCCLQSSSHYHPQRLEGEFFCFLPLSVQTGLPVHVSANFAVLNDRTGIHTSDSESPSEEVQWNVELCKTVIPKAYYSMLLALYQLCCNHQISSEDYKFYCLWPLRDHLKTHNPWNHVVQHLYFHIASSKLFYSNFVLKWLQLCQCHILSNDILLTSKQTSELDCVVGVIEELKLPTIDLPSPYLQYFPKSVIDACTIHEGEFIDIFFNNIEQLSRNIRNEILFHVFQVYAINPVANVKQHLIKEKCVPCTPDGSHLKKCSEVIDPCASFASLYDDSDGVFPIDDFHNDRIVHVALLQLNIIQNQLPWEMIVQRVATIPILHCVEETRLKALQRTALVLKCIEKQLDSP